MFEDAAPLGNRGSVAQQPHRTRLSPNRDALTMSAIRSELRLARSFDETGTI